jgi:hypothetical protein
VENGNLLESFFFKETEVFGGIAALSEISFRIGIGKGLSVICHSLDQTFDHIGCGHGGIMGIFLGVLQYVVNEIVDGVEDPFHQEMKFFGCGRNLRMFHGGSFLNVLIAFIIPQVRRYVNRPVVDRGG